MLTTIYVLLTFIPNLDPKIEKYNEFFKTYRIFRLIIIFFFLFILIIVGLNNLGQNIPVAKIMPLSIGLLFILMGNYLGKLKSNWFIGFRNMWTLSDENIWNKTNRLAGKIFIISGLLLFLTTISPSWLILPIFIFSILLIVVVPNLYSYFLFKNKK